MGLVLFTKTHLTLSQFKELTCICGVSFLIQVPLRGARLGKWVASITNLPLGIEFISKGSVILIFYHIFLHSANILYI